MKSKIAFFLALFLASTIVHANGYFFMGPTGSVGVNPIYDSSWAPERVCGFNIRAGARVDAIQLKVCNVATGTSKYLPRRGGSGGYLNSFDLERDEYVIAINGYIGKYSGSTRVFGLQIVTNKRTSPTFGTSTIYPFYFQAPTDGKYSIQGIIGDYGNELDSIGVYISDRTGI